MAVRQMLIADLTPGLKFTCPRYGYSGKIEKIVGNQLYYSWDDEEGQIKQAHLSQSLLTGLFIKIPDKPKRKL